MDEQYYQLLKRLVDRLEHLSADSTYAHQASGLRGTLLRYLERVENGACVNKMELDQLVDYGFELLELAAREIGGTE